MNLSIPDKAATRTTTLAIRGLRAGYGERNVLHGVDLEIQSGEWLGLLGPNGSGKSSLIACITGRLSPRDGEVRVVGFDARAQPTQACQHIGYAVPPESLPAALTGWQCLQVYAAAKQLAGIDTVVRTLANALRLTSRLDDSVGTYSLGMRQKLSVLLALLGTPELIVLDEAFNGLDPASAVCLKRHLHERLAGGRCSVLLATHGLDVIEHHADRAVLLHEGRIAGHWNRTELQALRDRHDADGLEIAMAEAIETADSGTPPA